MNVFCSVQCAVHLHDLQWQWHCKQEVLTQLSHKSLIVRLEQHRGHIDLPLIWDLTHNVQFSQWKEPSREDYLPCLLRGHRFWHVGRKRFLIVLLISIASSNHKMNIELALTQV